MSAICPNCGNENTNPYSASCPSCGRAAAVDPRAGSGDATHDRKSHLTGVIGLGLGVLVNLVVVIATLIALPWAMTASIDGQELDTNTAMAFGLGILAVGGLGLVGLTLSVIGTVLSKKKALSIVGIIVCLLPPVTYIMTCLVVGIVMGATGQLR